MKEQELPGEVKEEPKLEEGCGYCGSKRPLVEGEDSWPYCPDCGGV